MGHRLVGRLVPLVALAVVASVLAAAVASTLAAAQTSGYDDVPDGAFYSVPVSTLAARGVFEATECDEGFCPDQPLDRKTMAVWIVRVLDGQDPPAVTQTRFNDVDATGYFAPFIERMVELGVTQGCGDGSGYCPEDNVTRAHMAAFLSRGYKLPDGPDPGFGDVPGNIWYAANVARLVASGITRGCGDGTNFCPEDNTTRAEMATFLHRAETRGEASEEAPAEEEAPESQPGDPTVVANPSTVPAAGTYDFTIGGTGFDPSSTIFVLVCIIPGGPVSAATPAAELAGALAEVGRSDCDLTTARPVTLDSDGSFSVQRTATVGANFVWVASDAAETQSAGVPIFITGTETVSAGYKAIASGWGHACAIRSDDTVTCWGYNDGWQVTDGAGEFTSISAGEWHNCGLRPDRTVSCWGYSGDGQADPPAGEFIEVSAGLVHNCGLRTDGTITCWGSNRVGKAQAPGGQFRSVTAGGEHSCGLRTDGTITCWGSDGSGQRDIPAGQYRSVSAGDRHTCAIRIDDTVACWGGAFRVTFEDPEGRFRSVSAGRNHSCGLRMDNAIVCWGNAGGEGLTDPPIGDFTAVSAGDSHSCGIRTDGTIACWGDTGYDPTDAPGGSHVSITAGEEHTCGLRPDGRVACWGDPAEGRTYPPTDTFTAVSAARSHTCGIRTDNTVSCWGANHAGQSDAPDFEFSAVAAGGRHTCGIRTDGFVLCWGNSRQGQTDGAAGRFSAITSGGQHSCAIRTDGVVLCWGENDEGQTRAPAGSFTDVAAGDEHTCGVRQDQAVVCWGNNENGQSDAPAGSFTDVAAGHDHSCGVRTDGTVVCWGANWWGKTEAPTGSFTQVAVAGQHSCGLRTNGTIACWGIDVLGLPRGAERVVGSGQPDPVACRPYGPRQFSTRGVSTAGFPLPENASPSTGTLRVAVLFVDFPDIRAGYSTRVEAAAGLPTAERYLEAMSYGRLDVQFEPINVWLRASKTHDQYLSKTAVGQAITTLIDKEAVELGDIHGQFRGVHIAMIVMPSTHFGGGNATGTVRSPDGTVGTTRVNTFPRDEPFNDPYDWGVLAAHELAHNLGLLDLYPYNDTAHERPEARSGRAWIQPEIGLMGMRASYLASARSRSVAHTWRWPSGQTANAYWYYPHAREMLAWSRWQLEWLDPSQIACITDDQATVTLHPVAEPGDGIAMAAIPLSGQEVLVIESRRITNFDEPYEFVFPGDVETTYPSLLEEGVLVYTVDARIPSGALPAAVSGDEGDGLVDSYPVLGVRDSVTLRGYTIAVTGDDGETHTVTITKTGN